MTTTSLEMSKRLKEAGVKIETEYQWVELWNQDKGKYWNLKISDERGIPAPTVDELLELLPYSVYLYKRKDGTYSADLAKLNLPKNTQYDKNPADALALLLIWVKENEK